MKSIQEKVAYIAGWGLIKTKIASLAILDLNEIQNVDHTSFGRNGSCMDVSKRRHHRCKIKDAGNSKRCVYPLLKPKK